MAISRQSIQTALEAERHLSQRGGCLEIISVFWEEHYLVLSVKPLKGRKSVAIDEALEGVRVKWGAELEYAGLIKVIDADLERIIVLPVTSTQPNVGETLWLFPGDFLGPLIDMWAGEMGKLAAKRLRQSREEAEPLQPIRPLGPDFDALRERQASALQNAAYRCSVVIGPPGTGKTFTIGALGAYLLRRFSNARILLIGPTNVAVDTALQSIDDRLVKIERPDIAKQMKRVGAHFDPRKYATRPHLLAAGLDTKVAEFLLLEASEPSKGKISDYIRWKDRVTAARKELGADIEGVAYSARVVGITVATAIKWHHVLKAAGPWPFVICDEASQIIGPAALMVPALGKQTIFAGDPQQLSPIVQSDSPAHRNLLTQTAFDLFAHAPRTFLNEQSRMAMGVCHAVSRTFYNGELTVCRKAQRDKTWKDYRSPYFVNGREVPRVCFEQILERCQYSQNYGGFIRFQSAKMVEMIVDHLVGSSYIDTGDVLILTPFRAQRTLIRSFLKRRHPNMLVSTVHRAQGSERKVVIFDPVDATSSFLRGKEGDRLINVAISRAQAHVIIPYHASELTNPTISRLHQIASTLFQTSGRYMRPFSFATAG
ncbi:DEAD/DEAH box helicase [Brucella rhizosphaerae]|uniref:DEAD/DEAH box helicase n=1 Tax=Brucella rhizosphaerae TaxID=571254 RepID=UPI000466ADA8|nr:DEAD/DEAH box helicase [Brucella rhizosphaerae]